MIRSMTDVEKAKFSDLISYHRTVRFRGIVRVVDNDIRAMVGFDDFTHTLCQMHVWSRGPGGLSRLFITECFRYAFDTCGLLLVISTVACNNAASLELTRKLGFRRILTIKDGYGLGTDLAIQEMRREECRWLVRVPRGRKE